MSAGTYKTDQKIHSLSFAVGAAGTLNFDNSTGNGVATMQKYMNTVTTQIFGEPALQNLIGDDWQIVWGPVVYCANPTGPTVHADNTMGCYYSAASQLFVVAIAGTNPNSPFGWLNEDFAVHTMVAWTEAGGTGKGNIATGTNVGLQILLGMKDSTNATMLAALSSYISKNTLAGVPIAVTGHSLGGALSPVLALYMANNSIKLGLSKNPIAAYPTAGPTPGDTDFVANYEDAIKANAIGYAAMNNTLDIVPLAWAASDLAKIPTLYDANIKPASSDSPKDAVMGVIASGLALNAQSTKDWLGLPKNPYTQISKGVTPLPGTFDQGVDDYLMNTLKLKYVAVVLPSGLKTYAESLQNVVRFVAQAVTQHTTAYWKLLNTSDFETPYKSILAKNKPGTAVEVDGVATSVKLMAGVNLKRIDPEAMEKAGTTDTAKH